jgi:hypothetical protein
MPSRAVYGPRGPASRRWPLAPGSRPLRGNGTSRSALSRPRAFDARALLTPARRPPGAGGLRAPTVDGRRPSGRIDREAASFKSHRGRAAVAEWSTNSTRSSARSAPTRDALGHGPGDPVNRTRVARRVAVPGPGVVVRRAAVAEAVGHDEVEHLRPPSVRARRRLHLDRRAGAVGAAAAVWLPPLGARERSECGKRPRRPRTAARTPLDREGGGARGAGAARRGKGRRARCAGRFVA